MYVLVSENMTACGGPMGSDHTWDNWRRYYNKLEHAKAAALKDYRKGKRDPKASIEWDVDSNGHLTSGDLLFVMYHVEEITPED